jgi:hypothetical protein
MKRKTANSKGELNLDLEPVAGAFARAIATGAAREIGCFGTRGGLTPCITIGQPGGYGEIRILASLPCDRGGIKQHLEQSVIPWLRHRAPWVFRTSGMIHGWYDPSAGLTERQRHESSENSRGHAPGLMVVPGPGCVGRAQEHPAHVHATPAVIGSG